MKEEVKKFIRLLPFVRKYFEGIATIFMLHRVCPIDSERLSPNENMKVSPQFLENFIIELKAEGYQFISLDRLYEILVNNEKVAKLVIFTLDDGYVDNYTYAYPIFKKHNIPFTIYITTSFPERKAILWWYVLEDLLLENKVLVLSNGEKYICKTKKQKEDAFLRIRDIILKFKKDDFLNSLIKLFSNYKIDWFAKANELCLSWEQIIEMSKDNLCTIGRHTKNHYALNQLPYEEVISEIVEANKLIEEKIGKKVEHFSYPFGTRKEIGQREIEIVKAIGIKTATTALSGTIYNDHKNYLACLPRIMLTESVNVKNMVMIRKRRVVTI